MHIPIKRILISLTLALPAMAAADYPVSLQIDAANSNGGLALLSESGWPVTIKLSVELPAEEPYPSFAIQPNFPVRGSWGFLIFDDPDGCLNPPAPSWQVSPSPECGVPEPLPAEWDWDDWVPPASDETYMEFWPDVDIAGVPDGSGSNAGGNADRQLELVDSAGSGGPEFHGWNEGAVLDCTPLTDDPDCDRFGPATGDEVVDGFGFGTDDDITGLVVIAEFGVGRTYLEPDFDLTSPVGARNLAALVNSVSYDLSDLESTNSKEQGQKGKPTETIAEYVRIWAHINMLGQVVRNIIQYDACVGNVTWQDAEETFPDSCDGDDLWRVDGGPIENPPFNFGREDAASIYRLEDTVFELRAFLVAGQAPSVLLDENGDGQVDSADAELAGYTLLSNEDSIEFLQLSQLICFGGGGNAVAYDLDGNGAAFVPIVCPAGPGDIARPPR
jgi:hypothetical protein